MPPIDTERLRLRGDSQLRPEPGPPRPLKGEAFLKGPIPLSWLEQAALLPGRSLHAAIALWYAAGLARSRSVALSNRSGRRFGLDRNAKYRALGWLEKASLITVERKLGSSPRVTLLSPPGRFERDI
jgi:hypothetical protein